MKYATLFALLAVVGCALPESEARIGYRLDSGALAAEPHVASQGTKVVRLAEPRAALGLDSERIQVQEKDGSLTFVRKAAWIEEPGKMLIPLLLRGLEDTGKFRAAIDSHSSAAADYEFETTLEKFTLVQAADNGNAHIEVVLRFILVRKGDDRVLSSRLVTANESVDALHMSHVIAAFNKALTRVWRDEVRYLRNIAL